MHTRQLVAAALSVPLSRLKWALQSQKLKLDGDAAEGRWRRFSAADVVRLGLWYELTKFGLADDRAAEVVNLNTNFIGKSVVDAMAGVHAAWLLVRPNGPHYEYEGYSGPGAADLVAGRRKAFGPMHLEIDVGALVRDFLRSLAEGERYLTAGEQGEDDSLEIETRARQSWDADPNIRAEFETAGGFDSYLAYRRAVERGQVKRKFGSK